MKQKHQHVFVPVNINDKDNLKYFTNKMLALKERILFLYNCSNETLTLILNFKSCRAKLPIIRK